MSTTAATPKSATTEAEFSPRFGLAVWTLTQRELVRFFRQRTRVIGALGQPFLFWILFGAGLRDSFRAPGWANDGMSYQEYFFPGVAVLIVMFTAIFSTISIIEDRREGFLQGVLVAPISRLALVLGKLCGGSLLAVIQAALFLIIGPLLAWFGLTPEMQLDISFVRVIAATLFLFLLALQLTALGYVIAWPMDSTQGFHAIMSVFLMPMWLLSGAFFPGGETGWLAWVLKLNPLTYGVAGLRRLLYDHSQLTSAGNLPSITICVAVTLLATVIYCAFAVWLTRKIVAPSVR